MAATREWERQALLHRRTQRCCGQCSFPEFHCDNCSDNINTCLLCCDNCNSWCRGFNGCVEGCSICSSSRCDNNLDRCDDCCSSCDNNCDLNSCDNNCDLNSSGNNCDLNGCDGEGLLAMVVIAGIAFLIALPIIICILLLWCSYSQSRQATYVTIATTTVPTAPAIVVSTPQPSAVVPAAAYPDRGYNYPEQEPPPPYSAGYPVQPRPQIGYPSQSGYPSQLQHSYPTQEDCPSQETAASYPPQEGYPLQDGYLPQEGYPPQQ